MNAIHFTYRDVDHQPQDLDSAFNDGYEKAANSGIAALMRWAAIFWVISTVAVGTFVIARSVFQHAPEVLSGLARLLS